MSGGFRAHFAHDPWPRRFVLERAPATLDYAERCWNATADAATWLPGDAVPETFAPFFAEMEAGYVRYLQANREALAAGAEDLQLDLGHGPVSLGASPYRERSRLDIRDEILRLLPAERQRLGEAVPAGVLEAYTEPPIEVPGVAARKNLFPGRG